MKAPPGAESGQRPARFSASALDPVALVAGAGALALLLAMLFPPFEFRFPGGFITNAGFGFILAPPLRGSLLASVNISLLMSEMCALTVITGLSLLVAHRMRWRERRSA